MGRTIEEIEALRREIATVETWYHAIDLGDGIVTPGALDMGRYLSFYPFPERLDGMRVLDVGCSTGFFSYEFERRGAAEVVAVDLPSWLAHDWTPRYIAEASRYSAEEKRVFDDHVLRRAFDVVGRALSSTRVRKEELRIYDISPERLGEFDLVFSGAMLMHVRDPILGLHQLRSVCAPEGRLVVSISTLEVEGDAPLARFTGEWNQSNFWQMSPACLRRVLEFCDFELLGEESLYELCDREGRFRDPTFVCAARPRGRG